jgi:hypothetical protein
MNAKWAHTTPHCARHSLARSLQVEHHFFPQMPPFAYVFAQPEVEAYCKEHGMPYRNLR